MAVGSLEPQFCVNLAQKLDLNYNNSTKDQLDGHKWTKMRSEFEANFSTKSMKDWVEIFAYEDACVSSFLELNEPHELKHNLADEWCIQTKSGVDSTLAASKLRRTPGVINNDESSQVPSIGFSTYTTENGIHQRRNSIYSGK